MTLAVAPSLMSAEELLAFPENDDRNRWLIRGQLREKPMTYRNRTHSRIMTRVAHALFQWLEQQPSPHGDVLTGEAGVRLRRAPDTVVGVDVAYISAELMAQQSQVSTIIEGAPVLAVEILSPNDTHSEVSEKIDEYLAAGVRLIWVINPHHRIVQVFRPGLEPAHVNCQEELSGDPELPGFRVPAARLFV